MRVHPLPPPAPLEITPAERPHTRAALRVAAADRPGWVRGGGRTPTVGEPVYCTAGAGIITFLHGRTGDGSRLLQIRLLDRQAPPFFAAASNVLVAPE